MDDGSYSPCRTRLINKQEAKRDPSAVWLRKKLPGDFFRTVLCALFWFDGQANDAGADAEFSVVLQLGDAGALLFEIGPIGRVEITQADDLAFYFDRAMPAGNFGIVQNNVCVRPSDRAKEGSGEMATVRSAFWMTSTTDGRPHFEQRNCTRV